MVIDNDESVIVCGDFQDTADFDPSNNIYELYSAGSYDGFVMKLDSVGDFIWAKQLTSTNDLKISSLIANNNGDIFVTGIFRGTADFDPSIAVQNLSSFGNNFNVFILKLNSNGDFQWVKQIGGTSTSLVEDINIDNEKSIIISGSFKGTCDFDPSPTVNNKLAGGIEDSYVLKLDSLGDFQWVYNVGGSLYTNATSVTTDSTNELYVTGNFSGNSIDFDQGIGVSNLSTYGGYDLFVLKIDINGTFKWVKQIGGSSSDNANHIEVNEDKDIFLAGTFRDTCDFDPEASVLNLYSVANSDVFLHKISQPNTVSMKGTFLGGQIDNVKVFPNPSNGLVNIFYENDVDHVVLDVINSSGVIIKENIAVKNNNQAIELPEASGVYYIRLKRKNKIKLLRVVKL